MSDRYARLNYGYTDPLDCSAYHSSSSIKTTTMQQPQPEACALGSARAQNAVAVEQFISNFISFFTSSYIGSLSDMRGRRTLLLVGLFLATLTPGALVLIQVVPSMSANVYYATSALSSGLVNTLAICLSSLSDVLPPKFRAPSFGLLLAAFSLGFALAPNFAIVLGNHLHVSILALVMIICGFLVIVFGFPETLSLQAAAQAKCMRRAEQEAAEAEATRHQQQQQQHQQEHQQHDDTANRGRGSCWPLLSRHYCIRRRKRSSMMMPMQFCSYRPIWELSILNRSRLFRLLSCLAFFNTMASSGDRTLLIYYVQEPDTHLGFTDADIAKLFLIVGLLGIFVQGFVLHHANSVLGERRLVLACFLCGVVHNLCYAMAGTGGSKAMIFTGAALSTIVGMAFPTISAIKSNNVHKCEQGRIQGALYSLQAVASALGPTALRSVHYFTTATTTKTNGNDNGGGAFSFLIGPGSMFCFASCLYAMAAYCAHLLPVRCVKI
jgi:MFS transporter, DHA1 family, tetracycline resistance protein